MGKLLEKLDLVKKAGKIEIWGDRKFSSMCVCMYVRHAQKIAKLLLNILFKKTLRYRFVS